jgi:hypothetical protein
VKNSYPFGGFVVPASKVSVTNSLKTLFPELAKQWHARFNNKLKPKDVTAHSSKKIWWICHQDRDHVWEASVDQRTAGKGCPFCTSRKIGPTNNLKARFPEVAAQWHKSKNGKLKPEDVAPCSSNRVWWRCPKGPDHEWQATPANRTNRGSGCPACVGKQASVTNSLASLFPQIAKEWHKVKNGKVRPSDVTSKSKRLIWWQCRYGHAWKQSVGKRTQRLHGCRFCKSERKQFK